MEIGTYPLEKTSIFQGADAQQVQKMLGVILPSIKTYVRGETICRAGETVSSLGIVLAGGATIELCDAWGNRSIIERLEPGEVFAEAYACLPGEPLMVSVTADAPTRVMFLGVSRMLSMGLEPEQAILTTNLLRIMARKNVTLSQRMMNILRQNDPRAGCCRISPSRPSAREAAGSRYRLTGRNWRIISAWSAARCPRR